MREKKHGQNKKGEQEEVQIASTLLEEHRIKKNMTPLAVSTLEQHILA